MTYANADVGRQRMTARRFLTPVIPLCFAVVSAFAAPPSFDSIFPAGGAPGMRVEATVTGKDLEKEPLLGWTSDPKVVVLAGEKPKQVFLHIAKDATPGPCLLRLYNSQGSTHPRIIEVGSFEEWNEKEPNDSLTDAKTSEARMNVTINGVLAKAGDVDTFPVRVRKGVEVTFALHGYALGSPMDPALRLLNERGVEVAGSHDTHNLDPLIRHTPAADGLMFIQVFAFAHPPAADVSLKGSANHVYRLAVTDKVRPARTDAEPKTLKIPAQVAGCLREVGEEDTFAFSAKKGDDLAAIVRAQTLRSQLDATLRIEDADGKVLAQADDNDGLDPVLRWKAPEDGDFKLTVADRFHGGSIDHFYELSLTSFEPSFTALLDTHSYRIEAGKTAEVKITVKLNGTFKGKILARAAHLPTGVTAAPAEVPAKGGEVKLTLQAADTVEAGQSPFAIELSTSEPDKPLTQAAAFAIPFTELRGDLLIPTSTQPWLTVAAKAPDKTTPPPVKVEASKSAAN